MKSPANQYAAELKRRIAEKEAKSAYELHITQPLLECDLGNLRSMPLLAWLHFNPLGPTTSSLFYVPVPETEEGLLAFRSDNPFRSQQAAFGIMPHKVAAEEIGRFAFMLFAANGHESCPLFAALPTSVAHESNWRGDGMAPTFNEELARTLFKGIAPILWPQDVPVICEYLRRYKGEPWKRTEAEFDEGLLSALITQDVKPASFDDGLFDEWFDLVTDPIHLQSERSNFPAAWQGAIDFKEK